MTEGTSTEGLDYRRLRGLSGFSFLPGDDISPSFTDRNAGNETAGGIVSKRYDEEDSELWHHKYKNTTEDSTDQMNNEPVPNLATPSISSENQRQLTLEEILPQDPSTSRVPRYGDPDR